MPAKIIDANDIMTRKFIRWAEQYVEFEEDFFGFQDWQATTLAFISDKKHFDLYQLRRQLDNEKIILDQKYFDIAKNILTCTGKDEEEGGNGQTEEG